MRLSMNSIGPATRTRVWMHVHREGKNLSGRFEAVSTMPAATLNLQHEVNRKASWSKPEVNESTGRQ